MEEGGLFGSSLPDHNGGTCLTASFLSLTVKRSIASQSDVGLPVSASILCTFNSVICAQETKDPEAAADPGS